MTTPADAIKSALDTNWNVGTGGTKPTLAVTEDITQKYPDAQETIVGRTWTYRHREVPVDSTFVNRFHDITFRVSTSDTTSGTQREDRLTEMVDEVKRIFRADGVTGFHVARVVTVDQSPSDKSRSVFRADLGIHLIEYLVNAATVAGSTASRDFDVGGGLTVADDTVLAGDLDVQSGNGVIANRLLAALSVKEDNAILIEEAGTPQAVGIGIGDGDMKFYVNAFANLAMTVSDTAPYTVTFADSSVSTAIIADLLMFGSANAAYVPMMLQGGEEHSEYSVDTGYIRTVGANNYSLSLGLPKPTVMGSLKLYLKNLKFGVFAADVNDFIGVVTIFGLNGKDRTQLDTDGTDHTSAGDKTFSGGVMPASAIDVSGYQSIYVSVGIVGNTVDQGMWTNFRMECYYAA